MQSTAEECSRTRKRWPVGCHHTHLTAQAGRSSCDSWDTAPAHARKKPLRSMACSTRSCPGRGSARFEVQNQDHERCCSPPTCVLVRPMKWRAHGNSKAHVQRKPLCRLRFEVQDQDLPTLLLPSILCVGQAHESDGPTATTRLMSRGYSSAQPRLMSAAAPLHSVGWSGPFNDGRTARTTLTSRGNSRA